MQARKFLRSKILPLNEILCSLKGYHFENVLDIGAGTGLILEFFHEHRIIDKGIGIEIDNNYFRQINSNIRITGINELVDQKFDMILFCDVLHHVNNKKDFIDNYVSKFLKEDGFLFIKEMNDRNLFCKYFNRIHDLLFAGQKISEISPADLKSAVSPFRVLVEDTKRIMLYDHYWILLQKSRG